jgi:hypothetical protein
MTSRPPRSKIDIALGLMCSSGLMLIFSGVPAAIIVGLQISYDANLTVYEGTILTAKLMLVVAATGIGLYWFGHYFYWRKHPRNKRRWF